MVFGIIFTAVMLVLTAAYYVDSRGNDCPIDRGHASNAMVLTGILTLIFPALLGTQWAGFAFVLALALMILFLAGMVGLALFLCETFTGQIGILDGLYKGDIPAYFKVLVIFIIAMTFWILPMQSLVGVVIYLGLVLIFIFGLEDSKPEWLPECIREFIE